MKIIVCMKQVPSSNEVRLHPVTKTIVRDGKQSVINPFDSSALELAVQIKERIGAQITALSMGIPQTETLLKDALSRGADNAVLLSDRAFAGADTLATSYTLSLGIKKIGGFDLIICGKMAVDGDTAQIGPELAQTLNIPHVTDITEVIFCNDKEIICRRAIDGGNQLVNISLPALITVVKEIQLPRLPSIKSIKDSKLLDVEILSAQSVFADTSKTGLEGSPTQVVDTFTPSNTTPCIEITGSLKEICLKLRNLSQGVE